MSEMSELSLKTFKSLLNMTLGYMALLEQGLNQETPANLSHSASLESCGNSVLSPGRARIQYGKKQ